MNIRLLRFIPFLLIELTVCAHSLHPEDLLFLICPASSPTHHRVASCQPPDSSDAALSATVENVLEIVPSTTVIDVGVAVDFRVSAKLSEHWTALRYEPGSQFSRHWDEPGEYVVTASARICRSSDDAEYREATISTEVTIVVCGQPRSIVVYDETMPILAFKPAPKPANSPMSPCAHRGEFQLTEPICGRAVPTMAEANAFVEEQFGRGWVVATMAHFFLPDEYAVEGLTVAEFRDRLGRTENSGLPLNTRMFLHACQQPSNLWSRTDGGCVAPEHGEFACEHGGIVWANVPK